MKLKYWSEEVAYSWFRHLFSIDRFDKGGWKFGNTISTDPEGGQRPAAPPEATNRSAILAAAEGRRSALGRRPKQSQRVQGRQQPWEKAALLYRKVYEDATYTCSNKAISRMYKVGPHTKIALDNMLIEKTASSEMLAENARYLVPCTNALLQFHMDEGFRGLKFRHYRAHQKALDGICGEFTKKEAGWKTMASA